MRTELKALKQHRKDISVLLCENKDLFAKLEIDLGQADKA